ncbi:alpha/beta hydrolase-fold protein [Catalinimonas niigatensis]|uniref:alpha/beta hydrolase-fold protein n=1 Tax=Catalinimonas niigatensis TaxID=1397264 RepID=UPI0026670CB1|nr:cupin domain-containing protein [Catalinimonas niigatensis]WPP51241.1 alpha/beta hydrolase-fold protein [Catalinimonas niigatensis]
MKKNFMLLFLLLASIPGFSQNEYPSGPNSQSYEGIPKGKISTHSWKSTVFKNTIRDYYVYIPAQYDASQPSALMIFQDGHTYVKEDGDFRVPTVFDNLISQGKMPVTIGLFVNPGHDLDAPPAETPWQASNRSKEYDEVSDTYARFLLEEMIPELKKQYHISDDPKMRAIGGISSGGICAFSAAWFYPEHFHKVLSHIGSFTDIRGGHNYPPMIRKNDRKDIKVFLQDGSNDLNNQYGNWWLANLQMESALKYKAYDYKFAEGKGGHNGQHGGAILPESLSWLWSDVLPQKVASGVYPLPQRGNETLLFSGETMHFSKSEFKTVKLNNSSGKVNLQNAENEQIFIVKEGEFKISINNKTKTIGPNSVAILLPNDNGSIESLSPSATFYTMSYQSKKKMDLKRGKKDDGSVIIDFDELAYKEHDKGGIRNYFHRATAMCPYYEMHVTNLNPGIKSHQPHTHQATEIILMIDGSTEMEIGNEIFKAKKGDVYFVSSNVPHAIKNLGDKQCMYFAFQWE